MNLTSRFQCCNNVVRVAFIVHTELNLLSNDETTLENFVTLKLRHQRRYNVCIGCTLRHFDLTATSHSTAFAGRIKRNKTHDPETNYQVFEISLNFRNIF